MHAEFDRASEEFLICGIKLLSANNNYELFVLKNKRFVDTFAELNELSNRAWNYMKETVCYNCKCSHYNKRKLICKKVL